MDKTDINALAKNMIESVRAFVARSEAAIGKRLDELDAKLSGIPAGPNGEKGEAGGAGPAGAPGERGAEGARGQQGATGERGLDGAKGEQGAPGVNGINGNDGAQGVAGKDGTPGIRGEIGEPGRNSAELEILPSIDEAKSYRRGTWASHNGGLIRAGRQTDAVKDADILAAGWVVMVEGVAAVVVTQGDDPRAIEVAAMLTSGTKAISAFHVPMIIDRGVWREGQHEKGDHVTWDGSGWIAQKATTDKPGTSDSWRLSTKRGRDGKDGVVAAVGASAPVRLK